MAGVVLQQPTVEFLLRVLARNGQLMQLCGFWPRRREALVPNSWSFSRFLSSVTRQADLVLAMFARLLCQHGCRREFIGFRRRHRDEVQG